MRTIGIGVIGWGFMGRTHTHALRSIPLYYSGLDFRVRLVCLCARHLEHARQGAEEAGFERYTDDYRELLAMPESLTQGEVRVESIPGNHPGGCLVFRLSYRGKSLVYATDFEHEESAFDRLAAFAQGTDLLLYDAQYTESEYLRCRGFGHSTAEKALAMRERCGAKRLLLIHHAPFATDERLLEREKSLPEGVSYARQGQVVCL